MQQRRSLRWPSNGGVLGVQSCLGNCNLLTGPKCYFGETVSQECAQKTNLKNVGHKPFHSTNSNLFYC